MLFARARALGSHREISLAFIATFQTRSQCFQRNSPIGALFRNRVTFGANRKLSNPLPRIRSVNTHKILTDIAKLRPGFLSVFSIVSILLNDSLS